MSIHPIARKNVAERHQSASKGDAAVAPKYDSKILKIALKAISVIGLVFITVLAASTMVGSNEAGMYRSHDKIRIASADNVFCPASMVELMRPKERQLAQFYPDALQLEPNSSKPVGLFFVGKQDPFETALDPTLHLPLYASLRDAYNFKYVEVETLEEICQEIDAASEIGPVEAVIIHAHGLPTAIQLSEKGLIDFDSDISGCLKPLDRSARVLLFSCSTAKPRLFRRNIAQAIAARSGRHVIAPDRPAHGISIPRFHPLSVAFEGAECREYPGRSSVEVEGCAAKEASLDSEGRGSVVSSDELEVLDVIGFYGSQQLHHWALEKYALLAAEQGHLECLESIIAFDDRSESGVLLTKIFEQCPENMKFHLANMIVKYHRFTDMGYLGPIFEWSAANGHIGIVKAFVHSHNFKQINLVALSDALMRAGENGHAQVIQQLIDSTRLFSGAKVFGRLLDLSLEEALVSAILNGHYKTIQRIVASDWFKEMHVSKTRILSRVRAAKDQHPDCYKLLADEMQLLKKPGLSDRGFL